MPRRIRRFAAPLLAAVASITCTDSVTGPHGARPGSVALAPSFSARAAQAAARMSAYSLHVDNVHVVLVRPPSETLIDTVVTVAPSDTAVSLTMKVSVQGASETLQATIELRQGATVLFSGTQAVTATAGATSQPAPVELAYAGPGATATTLKISPANASLPAGTAMRFSAKATDASGTVVSGLPLAWSSTDTTIATVDTAGTVRGVKPGQARIAVMALSGLTDTVPVTVIVASGPAARLQVVRQPAAASRVGFVLDTVPSVQVVDSAGHAVARAGIRVLAHPIPQFAYDTTPCLRASASRIAPPAAPVAPVTRGFTRAQVLPRFVVPQLHAAPRIDPRLASRFPVRGAPHALMIRSARVPAAQGATPRIHAANASVTRGIQPNQAGARGDFFYGGCGPIALTTSDTAVTDSSGIASFPGMRLYGEKGAYAIEMIALDTALASATTRAITLAPGNPDHVNSWYTWFSGNPGDTIRDAQVMVQDTVGNGITGQTVHWFATQGSVLAGSSVTDTSGAATQPGWVLPDTAGSFTLLGIADAFPNDTIVFTANVQPLQPTMVKITGGQDQMGGPGVALANPLAIQVLDQNGHPMNGISVHWTPYTGGTVSDTLTVTDSSGSTHVAYTMSATSSYHTEWVEYIVEYNGSYWFGGYFFSYAPPPGMTKMWLPHDSLGAGGSVTSSDAWADTANWQPHGVPTTSDFIWVPSTWRSNPHLSASTSIGTMWVEGGAYVEVDSLTLDVYGDLRAQYTGVDALPGGQVVLHKTNAPVSGYINANVIVTDGAIPDTAYGMSFYPARDLTVSGGTFDIGDLGVYVGGTFRTENAGTLRMATSSGASLDVGGDAVFAGGSTARNLTTGWIYVGGKLTQLATVSPSSFAPTTDSWLYMIGDSTGTSAVSIATPASSHLRNVILNARTTQLSPGVVVDSTLGFGTDSNVVTLSSPGTITVNGALQLSTATDMRGVDTVLYHGPQFPTTYDSLAFGPKLLRITGSTASQWYAVSVPWVGNVEVDSGATFTVNDSLRITGSFTVKGANTLLAMPAATSRLIIDGDALFDGGDESNSLVAGTLEVRGAFTQAATNSPLAYAATMGHTTLFSGSASQAVNFATPDSLTGSRFGALLLANRDTAGVRLTSRAFALDTVHVADSTRFVVASGDTLWTRSSFSLGNASRLTLDGWLSAAACYEQANSVIDGANAGRFTCSPPAGASLTRAAATPAPVRRTLAPAPGRSPVPDRTRQ